MKDFIVLTHFKSIWQKERSTTRGYFLAGRAMLWFPVSIYTPTSGVFFVHFGNISLVYCTIAVIFI